MRALGVFVASLVGRALILVAFVSTFLGFGGSSQWQLIFLDQPRPHYCLVACVGLSLVALLSHCKLKKQWITLGLISLLINTYLVLPNIFPYSRLLPSRQKQNTAEISVAHLTLDSRSVDFERIEQYLDKKNIDIVSILEIPLTKLIELDSQLEEFDLVSPNVSLNLTSSAANAWLLSKSAQERGLKVQGARLVSIPKHSAIPMMEIDIFFEPFHENIRLLSFQARRPTNAVRVALFHKEFSGLIDWYRTQEQKKVDNIIVAGDFNTAPWSATLRKVIRSVDIKNTASGYGLQTTWHSKFPSFLRMPIDHILCSQNFKVVYREAQGDIGSDHVPVMARLSKV